MVQEHQKGLPRIRNFVMTIIPNDGLIIGIV